MGTSQSKNVASAVAEVTNTISQQTEADQSQVDIISQKINTANCSFTTGGDFNVNLFASSAQKSTQILDALQDSHVQNDLAQKMAQQALSKVGSLGVGFSEATNNISTFAKSKNVVVDGMRASSRQMSITDQEFNCENSSFNIGGDINWNFTSEADFLSSQTLSNEQVSNLVNNITQEITQKSTAKVAGIGGSLLILAVLIAAVGYAVAKPLDTTSGRILISSIILVILAIILAFMYLKNAPPFFEKPLQCSPYSTIGGAENTEDCVDVKMGKSYLKSPPLRYINSILGGGGPQSGVLLDMVISGSPEEPNMGYTQNRYAFFKDLDVSKPNRWNFDTFHDRADLYPGMKPNQLPNPLTLPGDEMFCRIPITYKTGSGAYNIGKCSPRPFTGISSDSADNCTGTGECFPASGGDDQRDVMSMPNIAEWNTYLNDPDPQRRAMHQKHARFVMCHFLEYPCMFYIDEDELVTVNDCVFRASDATDKSYRFQDFGGNLNVFLVGTVSGGHIVGPVGVYNDNAHKLNTFMKRIGVYILLFMIVVVFLILWLRRKK